MANSADELVATVGDKPVGFRDWTYKKYVDFVRYWDAAEEYHPEQAALAITCEHFGLNYMTAEWTGLIVAGQQFEARNGETVQ